MVSLNSSKKWANEFVQSIVRQKKKKKKSSFDFWKNHRLEKNIATFFQIFQCLKTSIPKNYPELEIWISCLQIWAGISNLKLRIVFLIIFWEIGRFEKRISLSENKAPLGSGQKRSKLCPRSHLFLRSEFFLSPSLPVEKGDGIYGRPSGALYYLKKCTLPGVPTARL